jgi:hypothetical protein
VLNLSIGTFATCPRQGRGRWPGARISTQALLDILEVPQRKRTAGTYRQLAKVMTQIGWMAVRVRDLTRGRYREAVRGYVRQTSAGAE